MFKFKVHVLTKCEYVKLFEKKTMYVTDSRINAFSTYM